MDVRLLFPSLYIKAADLLDAQKRTGRNGVTLTISRVTVDDLKTDRGTEKKPVVYFREMEKRKAQGKGENKRLVLNKTNANAVAKLYGYETEKWQGKPITLYPATCQAFGQVVDCVRIREEAPPQQRQPEPEPDPEPEAPVEWGPEDASEVL